MNEEYNAPNTTCCGRPMAYDTKPKCNYTDCCMNEYAYKQKACIRSKQPDCESQAVIPSITVETVDGISNLANCFVHVTSNNTTYYVDDKHRIMVIWAGPVEITNYDIDNNPLKLRSQFCMSLRDGVYTEIFFDNTGVGHVIGVEA